MAELGRIRYSEPETLTEEVVIVWVNETHVTIMDFDTGDSVQFPRTVAKEVGRTIVKGQRP